MRTSSGKIGDSVFWSIHSVAEKKGRFQKECFQKNVIFEILQLPMGCFSVMMIVHYQYSLGE